MPLSLERFVANRLPVSEADAEAAIR
jgi:hypothetical protein